MGAFEREAGDLLFFAIFPDAEIFLGEIKDWFVFFVDGYGVYQDRAGFCADDGFGGALSVGGAG